MKLADHFALALEAAEARARASADGRGASEWAKLPKGAQFAVQVSADRLQVVLSRQHTPVGYPTEEGTFCAHFGVPPTARRQDLGRTSDGWYKVTYTWTRVPPKPQMSIDEIPLFED